MTVYNVITSGNSIRVNGVVACTLGHGLTDDVVEHNYFGNKASVMRDLKKLDNAGLARGFIQLGHDVRYTRDATSFRITAMVKV